MNLSDWWQEKCKSCKHYHIEIEDMLEDEEAASIFPGLGYCHFNPPRVLMDEGKPVTVWPEVTALDFCGKWTKHPAVKFHRRKEQTT